ncbi:MAG: CapA family protein [Mesorhizobium sp.]|uniref:CapA family protein n=2 Tax=Mesorhizobium sp. TaxID=1871066 RepID=UPI000FE94E73|nr:CapA family protein [Mesorhizobium sp.]RWM22903.1 MAG: CapA family protein [Mesorhizobium sp.]TIP71564.1 MAG: CapA family protein [Mesorhizobium sp.]TIQ06190.1 MAG: CapA family protein [Mesorhizobium sp.]TIR48789.1 MAG: CapA family protein [Mesorhizobium sp.]TJV97285.1 MAG: CapA family protein [Mesorhizobium sp.]
MPQIANNAAAGRPLRSSAKLFLCGDVMLGRGIDQILASPGDPHLYERYVKSATTYVELAERINGPIPRKVDDTYVWGDALAELDREAPDARIINVETSITTSLSLAPKWINYKMNPANIGCLAAARVDCCVLANNHVLDWDEPGLVETLDTLRLAGLAYAGAGLDADEAAAPAAIELADGGRVLVFGFALETSGVPASWAAGAYKPGVNLLADVSAHSLAQIARSVQAIKQPGDLTVASIHWGGNWGYQVAAEERALAHALIDVAGFDVVHGHSSHHPKPIEIHDGRVILYGCGDFLTDYEGITGYESFRGELALMYLPRLAIPDGTLVSLELVPFRLAKFRLNRASAADAAWLAAVLERESSPFGTHVALANDNRLTVLW